MDIDADKWKNLPGDLLIAIVEKLDFPENIKFSAVSKSWELAAIMSNAWPPPRSPYLLLAEATGAITTVSSDDESEEEDDEDIDGEEEDEDEDEDEDDIDEEEDEIEGQEDWIKGDNCEIMDTPPGFRGLYSLSGKTYVIELPEASGKLVLGTNKGWLVTLGSDLQINLLHPLSRQQIPLPDMLAFSTQYEYDEDFPPRSVFDMFIDKVAMSWRVPTKYDNIPPPIIMAIYGEHRRLAFARLGDQVWTDIKIDTVAFKDIIYHKEKIYAVNRHGNVFICDIIDYGKRGGPSVIKIEPPPTKTMGWDQKYLVETLSGSNILQIVRTLRGPDYASVSLIKNRKYHTGDFSVWKLEITFSDCDDNPSYTWIRVNYLENESLFIGKTSSFLIPSSKSIKPNCIYYTEDSEYIRPQQNGTDMGVFDMKNRTIEPHFTGKSIHPFAPPLWYI